MNFRTPIAGPLRLWLSWALVALASLPAAGDEPAASSTVTAGARGAARRYALDHRGDAARGRRLFASRGASSCIGCHKVQGEGGDVGPDLTDIGNKFGRELLIESLLEPSRQIEEGYRLTLIALADGRVLSGLVRGESAEALTLLTADGQRHTIDRSEIAERRLTGGSLMPANVASSLDGSELADLVAYLQSLRSSAPHTSSGRLSDTRTVVVPAGFRVVRVADGLTGATALAVAGDGRVFVCEQVGALRVVKADRLLSEPLLRLDVDASWERGLIGVALDPKFAENGFVYVCYTVPRPYPHHRISRFRVAGDEAVPGSEAVLLEGDDQTRLGGSIPAGHQGGALHFGPDGKLYIAIGEQTAGSPAQDLHSLLGKLLRINPDGTIPEDNPFVDKTQDKYRAIWALGLRNPFTFAFQEGTGRLLINDVGGRAEEINEGAAGANYGWPAVEHGPTPDPRFRGPIHWYPTASIAGGAFCPRKALATGFPTEYRGKYFFMDFIKGWIRVLDPDAPAHPVAPFAERLARPVDLAFASDGSLYVLVRDAWVRDRNFQPGTGILYRVVYEGRGLVPAR
jgi:putative heme-binding domain-containing protein